MSNHVTFSAAAQLKPRSWRDACMLVNDLRVQLKNLGCKSLDHGLDGNSLRLTVEAADVHGVTSDDLRQVFEPFAALHATGAMVLQGYDATDGGDVPFTFFLGTGDGPFHAEIEWRLNQLAGDLENLGLAPGRIAASMSLIRELAPKTEREKQVAADLHAQARLHGQVDVDSSYVIFGSVTPSLPGATPEEACIRHAINQERMRREHPENMGRYVIFGEQSGKFYQPRSSALPRATGPTLPKPGRGPAAE